MLKRKGKIRRWFAIAMTVILLTGQGDIPALAQEEPSLLENSMEEELQCVCEVRCTPEQTDEACPVCAADYDACVGNGNGVGDEGTDAPAYGNDSDDAGSGESGGIEVSEEMPVEAAVPEDHPDMEEEIAPLVEDEGVEAYAVVGQEYYDGKLWYKIINDDEVEVAHRTKTNKSLSDVIKIPETVNLTGHTYRVTSIADYALSECELITEVEIPESVTDIGQFAFWDCFNLTRVKMPKGITKLNDSTFLNCYELVEVEIPEGVVSLDYNSFANCRKLSAIAIPESVTSIGNSCFFICRSLTSIKIPKNVTSLGYRVCSDCINMESATISENLTELGKQVFYACEKLKELRIVVSSDGEYHFPEVGEDAFGLLPDEREIVFVNDRDEEVTGQAYMDAFIEAAKNDGDGNNSKWYGWSYKGVPVEKDTYKAVVNAQKDNQPWTNCDRVFALSKDDGVTFAADQNAVEAGTYVVYDVTGLAAGEFGTKGVNTGVSVEVTNADVTAAVDYYTVAFYDGTEEYGAAQIILRGQRAAKPVDPVKEDLQFAGWKTEDQGGVSYDFSAPVSNTTAIYASWAAVGNHPGGGGDNPDVGADNPSGGGDNNHGGGDYSGGNDDSGTGAVNSGSDTKLTMASETFSPRVENNTAIVVGIPQASGSKTAAVGTGAADDREPKTGDASPIEIYATVAMVAGLTYLLLYFIEESHGMTEREKEVFVAAFVRWAKKGGSFRKCCALAAIFCLLVYYHAVGKRMGENTAGKGNLKQA